MGWMGKLVGGALGWFIGGPLGLVAGIAFGNLFDKADQYGSSSPDSTGQPFQGTQYSDGQRSQMVFFLGAFSMLARIATADGRLLPEEQRKVEEFIEQDLHLDATSRQAAMRVFHAALSGGGTFEQYAAQFARQFSHEQPLLELMIDIFYRVAAADGTISDQEERLIELAGRLFGLDAALLASIRGRYAGATKSSRSYAVLGLQPDASVEDIKKAYRRLSREFHPDAIASKGLPEEFTTYATEKFRNIQQAYEDIKGERGIV